LIRAFILPAARELSVEMGKVGVAPYGHESDGRKTIHLNLKVEESLPASNLSKQEMLPGGDAR